eukprot:7233324-Prymnesium_polylepis.1
MRTGSGSGSGGTRPSAQAEARCQSVQSDPVVLLMARVRRHEQTGERLFRGMKQEGIGGGG